MRGLGSLAALALLGAVLLPAPSTWAQLLNTSALPVRLPAITGARLETMAYQQQSSGFFSLFGQTAKLELWCYSPLAGKSEWSLLAPLNLVSRPNIWYMPLNYQLGQWRYDMGDTLTCELWNCNGGCSLTNLAALPNAAAGDTYLGRATVPMSAYRTTYSQLYSFIGPDNFNKVASVFVDCEGCNNLWASTPSWVNPYAPPPPSPATTSPALVPPASPAVAPPPSAASSPLPPPVVSPPPPVASPPPPAASPAPPPPTVQPPSPPPVQPSPSPTAPPVTAFGEAPPPAVQPPPLALAPPPEPPAPAAALPPPPPPAAIIPPSPQLNPTAPPPQSAALASLAPSPPPPPPSTAAAESTSAGLPGWVIAVIAAVALLLVAAAVLGVVGWRRGWFSGQRTSPEFIERKDSLLGHGKQLRIRVRRPGDAEPVLRSGGSAVVETTWRPELAV